MMSLHRNWGGKLDGALPKRSVDASGTFTMSAPMDRSSTTPSALLTSSFLTAALQWYFFNFNTC